MLSLAVCVTCLVVSGLGHPGTNYEDETMLTDDDKKWLADHRCSVATWCDFYLAQLKGVTGAELSEVAGKVLLHHQGRYILAQDLAAEVVQGVRYSQVFEQWNYDCACKVHNLARSMPPLDGAVFLAASGYLDVSMDELADASAEAIDEARLALYGEP